MGKYDFQSPGAAAGDQVRQILNQQQAEQRQALLDEIARQNSESQRNYEAAQTDSVKTRDELSKLEVASKGLQPGADVSTNPNLELFKKYGKVSGQRPAGTNPVVTTTSEFGGGEDQSIPLETGPQEQASAPEELSPILGSRPAGTPKAPDPFYFQGDPEDQKRDRITANLGKVMSEINADPKMSYMDRMLRIQQATEGENMPGQFYSALQPQLPMDVFNQETGKLRPATRENGEPIMTQPGDSPIINWSRPPRVPAPHNAFVGMSPDGKSGITYNPITDGFNTRALPQGGMAPKPSPASGNKNLPSPAEFVNLAKLAIKATPNPGSFSQGLPKPGDVAAYNQALNAIIARYPVNKDILQTALDIVAKEPDATLPELMENYTDSFDENELAELQKLLLIMKNPQQS